MELKDEDIKKALSCCVKGDCFRCPLYYIHNCRTALREGMNNILNKQQIELVLKRNTINDLNNKLTEKQSENEKLQSLCASKDVIIKEHQAEIERLESLLNQLFKDVDYKLQYIYELEKKFESDQAEAIKEFAERFIDEECAYCSSESDEMIFFKERFDNLLAEMVGEQNA